MTYLSSSPSFAVRCNTRRPQLTCEQLASNHHSSELMTTPINLLHHPHDMSEKPTQPVNTLFAQKRAYSSPSDDVESDQKVIPKAPTESGRSVPRGIDVAENLARAGHRQCFDIGSSLQCRNQVRLLRRPQSSGLAFEQKAVRLLTRWTKNGEPGYVS